MLSIKFHFYNFVMIIITYFYIIYRENKCVNDFSTIFISIIDYIDLTFTNHVENIKLLTRFHFVNNFIRIFSYRCVYKIIQNYELARKTYLITHSNYKQCENIIQFQNFD